MTGTKRRKLKPNTAKAATVDVDRISSLPDFLLCHILSFLKTRESVATMILSRRWRHLWKDVQVFDFDLCPLDFIKACVNRKLSPDIYGRFVAFINAVLVQRRARDIRKFRLRYGPRDGLFNDAAMTTWICAAAGPRLEELQLDVANYYSGLQLMFVVPPSLFTCTALVNLCWTGGVGRVELTQASPVHLPSLKTLDMHLVSLDNIDKVLSGCPVLKTLTLFFDERFRNDFQAGPSKISVPKIRVPSLKTLKFRNWRGDAGDPGIVQLDIDTPSLEHLTLELELINFGSQFLPVSICNLQNVVDSHLYLGRGDHENVGCFIPKLLNSLCRTKSLDMDSGIVTCLLRAPNLDLPEFRCLLNLELDIDYPCFDTSFLMNMLERCHMLQLLKANKSDNSEQSSEPWTEPTTVPDCVVSHLTNFEFGIYEDSADEHAFIAYILQQGLVLKTMTIHTGWDLELEKKYNILKGLSSLPRGSNICELKFD